MRLWRSQRLLDGCCTFDSSFFEAIRRKLSTNITWVPGLAPAGDGSWEIHKINGERAVDLQPNVESPWVGCERGEMLLCLLAERVEEDVVVDGSKLWRVSDCESCPYDLWWWKLVKAKWENALTTDSSSSFLVQSQVFVPKWPFYPISTFTSFFLLEPLAPFQEHYDRLFADVWNRKIENILNCNFTFAIGRGNWAFTDHTSNVQTILSAADS